MINGSKNKTPTYQVSNLMTITVLPSISPKHKEQTIQAEF